MVLSFSLKRSMKIIIRYLAISLFIIVNILSCNEDEDNAGPAKPTTPACWEQVGSPIEGDNIFEVKFYNFNNTPYVFWYEYVDADIRTYYLKSAYFNGNDWVDMGLISQVDTIYLHPQSSGLNAVYYDNKVFVADYTYNITEQEGDCIFCRYSPYIKFWDGSTWQLSDYNIIKMVERYYYIAPKLFTYKGNLYYLLQNSYGFSYRKYTNEYPYKPIIMKYVKENNNSTWKEYVTINYEDILNDVAKTDYLIFDAIGECNNKLILICSDRKDKLPIIYFLAFNEETQKWDYLNKIELPQKVVGLESVAFGSDYVIQMFKWHFTNNYLYYLYQVGNDTTNTSFPYYLLQVKIDGTNITSNIIDLSFDNIKNYINYQFDNPDLLDLTQTGYGFVRVPPFDMYCNNENCFIVAKYCTNALYYSCELFGNMGQDYGFQVIYYIFSFTQKDNVQLTDFSIYPPKDGLLQRSLPVKVNSSNSENIPYISYIDTDTYTNTYYDREDKQYKVAEGDFDVNTCDLTRDIFYGSVYTYSDYDIKRDIKVQKFTNIAGCKEEYTNYSDYYEK